MTKVMLNLEGQSEYWVKPSNFRSTVGSSLKPSLMFASLHTVVRECVCVCVHTQTCRAAEFAKVTVVPKSHFLTIKSSSLQLT